MQFHLGAIPDSPDFIPDTSWSSLREPSPWLAQIIALPIGVVSAILFAVLWFKITPLREETLKLSISSYALSFAGMVVVHELIHALVHPMAGSSPRSILGFWPSRIVFYAHYDGELSRNHFIVILLMPLIIISLVPLIVASIMQVTSGWVAFISIFNACLACVDILGVGMVIYQIPVNRIVRNKGWRTYYRKNYLQAL